MYKKISRSINFFKKPHILFLIISLSISVLFAVITPPLGGPDEDAHFYRSYGIAKGDFILNKNPQDSTRFGVDIPNGVREDIEMIAFHKNVNGYYSQKFDHKDTVSMLKDRLDTEDEKRLVHVDVTNTYPYNIINYMLPAAAMAVSDYLGMSTLFSIYFARIISAVGISLILSLAVYLMPVRKWIFAGILLTPMLVFQNAMITSDGFAYAILVIFVAYIIKMLNLSKISRKNWVVLSAFAVVLSIVKVPLFIFTSLALLLIKDKKTFIKSISILIISILIFAGSFVLNSKIYQGIEIIGAAESNPELQLENIKQNPKHLINIMVNTYSTTFGDQHFYGVIGILGSADTFLPAWTYIILAGILTLGILTGSRQDKIKIKFEWWKKIGIISLILMYVVAVNLAVYISYSPLNFPVIYGVQGRYFIPVLIIAALFMPPIINISNVEYRKMNKIFILTIVSILFISLIILFQRYYLWTP